MIGLGLAAVYALFGFAQRVEPLKIFKKATNFLYLWYLVVAIVMVAVSGFAAIVWGAGLGLFLGGILGSMVGATAGGTIAFVILLAVALSYILQIAGAFLLRESLTLEEDGTAVWSNAKLVIGVVLLMMGIAIVPKLS